jgi:hypothetical protein
MKPSAAIADKSQTDPRVTVLPTMVVTDARGRPVYVNLTALALQGQVAAGGEGVEDHQPGLSPQPALERQRH